MILLLSKSTLKCQLSKSKYIVKSRNISDLSKSFWKWTTKERPSWKNDFKEAAIIFTVFGLAGTTSMSLIHPTLKVVLGVDGPFLESPVTYITTAILIASPAYAITVFTIGTLFGRHIFFAFMAKKVIGRFMPKSIRDKILVCPALPK